MRVCWAITTVVVVLLAAPIAHQAWAVRSSSAIHCVPADRVADVEASLFGALNRSLVDLRAERNALQIENRRLLAVREGVGDDSREMSRGAGGVRSATDSRPTLVSQSRAAFSAPQCGTARAHRRAELLWRNNHRKFVKRTVSLGDASLYICKHPPRVDLEISLSGAPPSLFRRGRNLLSHAASDLAADAYPCVCQVGLLCVGIGCGSAPLMAVVAAAFSPLPCLRHRPAPRRHTGNKGSLR